MTWTLVFLLLWMAFRLLLSWGRTDAMENRINHPAHYSRNLHASKPALHFAKRDSGTDPSSSHGR